MDLESLEFIGLTALALFLYGLFFYWYAKRNRKIDVYIQPHIFKWQVKTGLLMFGTLVILVLALTSNIFLALLEGTFLLIAIPVLFLNIAILPLLLLTVLFTLIVWPGLFVLVLLFLQLLLIASQHPLVYQSYVFILLGMIPIYISLFISARHGIDTLILRLEQSGYSEVANHLTRQRIGIGAFILGVLLPLALFTRWIRKGTKAGKQNITLSISSSGDFVTERYVTVELPEMLKSFEKMQKE